MNREIVTQDYLDKRRKLASSIQQKINRTVSSDAAVPHDVREAAGTHHETFQGPANIEELLDQDLEEGTSSVREIKLERIHKLKEADTSIQKEETTAKDGYGDKLVKYIPSEAIAFYLGLTGILANTTDASNVYYSIGLMVIGLAGTTMYLKSVWKIRSNAQIAISCIAFLAWALSFEKNLDISPTLQALMLPIVTFLLPLIDPPPVAEKSVRDKI